MAEKGRWPGTWNAICDVCGFKFPSDKIEKRWDGLMVCRDDWEPRHPQDFIKVRPERIAPPWVRPEAEDVFLPFCSEITRQGIAGIGTAGCAQAGYVSSAILE